MKQTRTLSCLFKQIWAVLVVGLLVTWSQKTSFPSPIVTLQPNRLQSRLNDTCANGYLTTRRTDFWKYMDGQCPAVADVLTSNDRLYVVFSLEVLANHRTSPATYEWQKAHWTFTFIDYSIPAVDATSFGVMKDPNVLILHAALPSDLLLADPRQAVHVNITAHLQHRAHTYDSVPFCFTRSSSLPQPKYELAACIKCVATEPWIHLLPEWIAYHVVQGFQHVYLYSIGDPTPLKTLLSPFLCADLLTIVDWEWQDNWVKAYAFSEAHQNACLLRARGVAEWIAFADVDEFWQPQTAFSTSYQEYTVADLLKHPLIHNESAIRANTWYFGSNTNGTKQQDFSRGAGNATIAKWVSRSKDAVRKGREKNIVRPESITYMGTHLVATGPREYMLDPVHQMRVVHYKPEQQFDGIDESMLKYMPSIKLILQRFGFQ